MSFVESTSLKVGAAVALAGALLSAAPAAAQVVGKTSAVNPASSAGGRTLSIGASIVHNERVTTDAKGSVQILFLDKTSLNVAANSSVVINDYVYDTKSKTGKMTVSVVKGLMRYVGGKISQDGEATVNTPSATIGVRGYTGVFHVLGRTTEVSTVTGLATATSICPVRTETSCVPGQVTTIPTGYTLTISGGGATTALALTTPAQARAGIVLPMSQPGQTGGASNATSSAVAVVANASMLINPPPGSIAQAPPPPGPSAATLTPTGTTSDYTLINTNLAIQTTTADTAAIVSAQQVANQNFAASVFALNMTNCCNPNNQTSPIPYLPANFAFNGSYVNTPVLGIFPAHSANATQITAPALQYGFNVTGTGSGQSSLFYVMTGQFANNSNGGLGFTGGFSGTRRLASDFGEGRGEFVTASGGIQVNSTTGLPIGGTIVRDTSISAGLSGDFFTTTNGLINPHVTYDFTQTITSAAPPAGLGSNRPTQTLSGYVGGLMQTQIIPAFGPATATPPYVVINQNLSPNDVTIQLDGAGTLQLQAVFNVAMINNSARGSITPASYQFGSAATNDGRSAYIDYDYFGAREAQASSGNPTSTINGQPLAFQRAAMAAIRPSDAQPLAPGVTFCQCDFTRWGAWSTVSDQNVGSQLLTDLGHMGFWVAGRLPNASEVPTSGTATYTGHVIANVANSGSQYIAGGNFTNNVNFGTRTGAVNAGLDNTNYSGTVNFGADPRNFGGNLAGSVGGRTMVMNGSFFRGTASPVGEMGGAVNVAGTGYLASGVFVGKQ